MMTLEEIIHEYEGAVAAHAAAAAAGIKGAEKSYELFKAGMAALRHQIWEDQLWHDAKTDPPKTPGLYYGKKDDTNSMYPCLYRGGVWVLDTYQQTKMDIVQWADYTAFSRGRGTRPPPRQPGAGGDGVAWVRGMP